MRGDSARVQELELELRNLRVAFEEYIGSSRELEDGLDRELADMHGKLAQSSAANEMLGSQLEGMEPLVRNLEASLEVSKKKLREEARMRRQAELAQVQIEGRYKESESNMISLREANENLRDECEALHEELSFKCRELEEFKSGEEAKLKQLDELSQRVGSTVQRREERSTGVSAPGMSGVNETTENTLNTKADTNMDDSYAEVLDELETVTEQLIATQQKLWQTEDRLRESDARVRELNYKLRRKASSGETEAENSATSSKPENEKRLMDELSVLRDELTMAQEELRATEEEAASYQERLKTLGDSNGRGLMEQKSRINDLREKLRDTQEQVTEYEELLEESREENARLIEEVSCLRDLLPGQGDSDSLARTKKEKVEELEELKEQITQETRTSVLQQANKEREREINLLREKFKKIFKENANLRQKVEYLESGLPQSSMKTEKISALKEENARLSASLQTTRENHRSAIMETESSWRKKLEKVTADSAELHQDVVGETSEVIETLERELKSLSEEKYYLQEKLKSLERVLHSSRQEKDRFNQKSKLMQTNLRSSRDEILKLRKKTGYLAAELENSKTLISKLDREGDSLRMKYASAKAELDVSKMILEDSGLEEETIAREDTIELKQQIVALSDSLDTIKMDYKDLMIELEESRRRFYDSQAEASRQTEEKIDHLKNRIEDLEDALENSRLERAELVRELEYAEKKYEAAQIELEATSKQSQKDERRLVLGKFEGLNMEKSDLKRRLQEADLTIETLQDALSALQAENTKLKAELENSASGNTSNLNGMRALEKLLGDNVQTREARDPDPAEKEPARSGLLIRSDRNENVLSHGQVYTRDPPTTRSLSKSINSVATESGDSFSVLRSQLAEVTRENEILKNKVISLATKDTAPAHEGSSRTAPQEEVTKLREQINALQICLENAENRSEEAENLEHQLKKAENKLHDKEKKYLSMEKDLELSKQHSDALLAEISALNDSLKETRRSLESLKEQLENVTREKNELQQSVETKVNRSVQEASRIATSERVEEFGELKDQLKKLTEEKGALQHQVDDSKIALSVSQYAQERNKEERRECAVRLEAATDEIYDLKTEVSKLEYALAESKRKQDETVRELDRVNKRSLTNIESMTEAENLTKQLKELSDENSGLQQMVTELEEALQTSQDELRKKCESVHSLEKSLVSTQEETRMLTDEISHLSSAFEDAKNEYDAVVDELEAVNELFDEARQEAERSGREAAVEEIRSEILSAQHHEQLLMKEQVQKLLDENEAMEEKVKQARRANSSLESTDTGNGQLELAQQEVGILKEALRSSSEQIKRLKEKEFNLTMSLKEAKAELKQTHDELERKIHRVGGWQDFNNLDNEVNSSAGHSSAESSTEYRSLRAHFQRLIETCDHTDQTSGPEPEAGYKAEGLRLKVELMDMSMSLDKLMKENALIEEEVVRLKSTSREMCTEAERQGRLNAIKEARAELKAERAIEMQEFKSKFNDLVLENTALEQKAREASVALEIAKVSQGRKIEELNALEDELAKAKKETRQLKEEVFNLTVDLERSKRGPPGKLTVPDQDAKVQALNRKVSALNIENTALQAKLRSASASLQTNRSTEDQNISALLASLKDSRMTIEKLEGKISSLGSEMVALQTENSMIEEERSRLMAALKSADEATTVATKNQIDKSGQSSSTTEADFLRSQLGKLVEEKADLQRQVDDARISLSLEKLSSGNIGRSQAENTFSLDTSASDALHMNTISSELNKVRYEHSETLELLQQMNDTMITVQASLSSKEGSQGEQSESGIAPKQRDATNNSRPGSLLEKAIDVKERMVSFTTLVLKSKRDYAAILAELEAANAKIAEKSGEKSSQEIEFEIRRMLTQEKETELKALREQIKVFFSQNAELENRMKETETELQVARQSVEKQKIELELYDMKYEESKKEASQSKREVSRLQSTLEGAQHDHRSLREQLENLNARVGELCQEAEERGKAAAAAEIRVGVRSLKEQERKELLDQFNLFYKENLALQAKLDEAESALAASRDVQDKPGNELKRVETTHVAATSKVEQLEAANKQLTQELDSLKQDRENTRKKRGSDVHKLESASRELGGFGGEARRVQRKDAKRVGHQGLSSERNTELWLLQDQFKKLSAKSAALGQKVEDAENAVAKVRDQQDRTRATSESQSRLAEKLKSKIEKTADDSKRKDDEIEELSMMMENRVTITEENVKRLEQEISIAKGALQVSHAGLVVMKREKGEEASLQSPAAEPRELEEGAKARAEIRVSKSLDRPSYESRDDDVPGKPPTVKRTRSYSPVPETATTAALEAIEGGKQKASLKRFDLKNAQRKIFGKEEKVTARTSPFAKRMAKHARRLELNRGKQHQQAALTGASDASSAQDESE